MVKELIYDLLEATWPGWFRAQALAAERWGLDWAGCSTPFVEQADGRVIAHVGVLDCRTVLGGATVRVGGIHGVAVAESHRGRGAFRRCMERALDWVDGRFETLVLTTLIPGAFERFGFRAIAEQRYTGALAVVPAPAPPRVLDPMDPGDVDLLRRLLAEREPLSQVCAPLRADVFWFNEARRPVHYLETLDAACSYDIDGPTLHLYDVAAPAMPPLSRIAAATGRPVDRAAVAFAPDRLAADLAPEPFAFEPGDTLMVRGAWPDGLPPFAWPRSMRW